MKTYEWPLTPQQREEISSAKLVTFDLFETLVCRKNNPRDSFRVYGRVKSRLRACIEFIWRIFQKAGITKDFKLETLRPLFGATIDKEFEADLTHLIVRESVLEVLKSIAATGKKIAIVTNTYYSRDQIIEICRKFEIPRGIDLVISSEVGFTKKQGLLKRVYKNIDAPHWHFGDDPREDGTVSKDIYVYVQKIWKQNQVFNSGIFSFPEQNKNIPNLRATYLQIAVEYENESNPWFWFGVLYSGPLGVSIAQALDEVSKVKKIDQIFLLARDGYLPFKFLQQISNLKIHYLPYSREISNSSKSIEQLVAWIQRATKGKKIVFFDLGWKGISASRLVTQLGNQASLILFGRWPWHKKIEDEVIFFGSLSSVLNALYVRRCPELVELALSAPHNSVDVLPEVLNDWIESIDFDLSGTRFEISRGSQIFQKFWIELDSGEISPRIGVKPLMQLMKNPNLGFLELASHEYHDFKGKRFRLVGFEKPPITFWIVGNWRIQKARKISLIHRMKYAGNEWFRRLRFPK
jgi:FMN phosphatase YigB (HAD superfamily)